MRFTQRQHIALEKHNIYIRPVCMCACVHGWGCANIQTANKIYNRYVDSEANLEYVAPHKLVLCAVKCNYVRVHAYTLRAPVLLSILSITKKNIRISYT